MNSEEKLHARTVVGDIVNMVKLRIRVRSKNSMIAFPFEVTKNITNIHIGPNVAIDRYANFVIGKKCHVFIGDGTVIGRYCRIAGRDHYIWIGKEVGIAHRVYLSTSGHKYEDVTQSIIKQEFTSKGPVRVEDGCWIGIGTCILPNVVIGKHSVIGANSVVNKDIPPYSVAVGSPARVIKKYDFEKKKWTHAQ